MTSLSLVRYRGNDYSVPVAYGHRTVLVKGYTHEVVIGCGSEIIARHTRSYEKHDTLYEPLHYLALLAQKVNAFEQAAPLQEWVLPPEFSQLRRLLEARQGKAGKREYIQVLRLLEGFALDLVQPAVQEALRLQAISFDAVKHLVLCRIERQPAHLDLAHLDLAHLDLAHLDLAHLDLAHLDLAHLDLAHYPHLPTAQVATPAVTDYLGLLTAHRSVVVSVASGPAVLTERRD